MTLELRVGLSLPSITFIMFPKIALLNSILSKVGHESNYENNFECEYLKRRETEVAEIFPSMNRFGCEKTSGSRCVVRFSEVLRTWCLWKYIRKSSFTFTWWVILNRSLLQCANYKLMRYLFCMGWFSGVAKRTCADWALIQEDS